MLTASSFIRGVLEFKVMGDLLKLPPHFNPSVLWKLPELINHVVWLYCLVYREENLELAVVNLILTGELDLITHDDWNTVANNSIEKPLVDERGRSLSSNECRQNFDERIPLVDWYFMNENE
ncbi:hypothetical protein D5086_020878 [Populus alba]|uniref:Uncharacterized protein n=2 Tax=Populus TaxID=3689 RepID=A0ACC4BLC5_POPAL|nr:hypothetical protein NC653_026284 [Populus alba x Populus x berolinensis]